MPDSASGDSPLFATTRWSVVLLAGQDDKAGADALARLCEQYWFPLYVWLRRAGNSQHDAEDLVQSFFARLLERDLIARADADRGRFRTFLLSALRNFAADEWRREHRDKRGGAKLALSLEEMDPEEKMLPELTEAADAELAFDRAWARTLLDRVLERLREECDGDGKAGRFDALKSFLIGERGEVPFAEAAAGLGISVAAVQSLVHRLRQRYAELLREEIAHTVRRPEEVDKELRWVLTVLAR
jgi:RNA polymerase sigma factor (sigma-70 family)